MLKQGCMATVYFDHGKSFFLTTLLAVDDARNSIALDMSSDTAINLAATKASKLIVTANLEGVKIQFPLSGVQVTAFEGREALRAALPASLLRLQRREYFRLDTPVANPIRCKVTIAGEDGSTQVHDFPLLDISGGGIGLMVNDALAPAFAADTQFANCRFELPQEGVITANMAVRSAFPVTTRNGHAFTRIGCEFENLPGARLAQIQRYITRIERERKTRLAGLE